MTSEIPEQVASPADWRTEELSLNPGEWTRTLSKESTELLAGIPKFTDTELSRQEFMWPKIAPSGALRRDANQILNELENGKGFCVVEDFPIDEKDLHWSREAFKHFAFHMGTPLPQTPDWHLVTDVCNSGLKWSSNQLTRGFASTRTLPFHTDVCDVTGLLCVNQAMRGGETWLVSSTAIHNEICRREPRLAEVLHEPFPWSWRGNQGQNEKVYYYHPIFGIMNGKLSSRYYKIYIELSQQLPGAKALSRAQRDALALLDELAHDRRFCVPLLLQPGDLLLLNNHVMYHARSRFEDFEEPERRRLLFRIWWSVPNSRHLPDSFKVLFGDTGAGRLRGGYPNTLDFSSKGMSETSSK